MNKINVIKMMLLAVVAMVTVSSCDDDDTCYYPAVPRLNALVTVKHTSEGKFYLQLDDKTAVWPVNMSASPFGDKEVRALASIDFVDDEGMQDDRSGKKVKVNWIDSILTKKSIACPAEEVDKIYGNDPIEVVDDWVTVAEDGYLTLRFRTKWGNYGQAHFVNLLTQVDENDPYTIEFRHNAFGDTVGQWGDGIVAFRLENLPDTQGKTVKLTLKYNSFSGPKSVQFDYCSRENSGSMALEGMDIKALHKLNLQ